MNEGSSQLESTNQALMEIFKFLFSSNSVLTWIHLGVLAIGLALVAVLHSLKPDSIPKDFPCRAFAGEVLQQIRNSASSFLVTFFVGFILFVIAVAMINTNVDGMLVQVLTYVPTLLFAAWQISTVAKGVLFLKQRTGM